VLAAGVRGAAGAPEAAGVDAGGCVRGCGAGADAAAALPGSWTGGRGRMAAGRGWMLRTPALRLDDAACGAGAMGRGARRRGRGGAAGAGARRDMLMGGGEERRASTAQGAQHREA
jgi:hypothetical protein